MRLLLLALALILPGAGWAQRPPTAANWRNHPAVRAIRAITQEVEIALRESKLTVQTDSAECNSGAVRLTAHLYTDPAGRVRKYVVEGGSGDSYSQVQYYYDRHGRLRFSFETLGAVNGTKQETRQYFDSTGARLYKDVRLLKGPGYPGGLDEVVTDPAADFRALCGPSHYDLAPF
jgi:hypothetical protein